MTVKLKNTRCDVTHITEIGKLMYLLGIEALKYCNSYTDGRGERFHAES
jgi:hypothetical protein